MTLEEKRKRLSVLEAEVATLRVELANPYCELQGELAVALENLEDAARAVGYSEDAGTPEAAEADRKELATVRQRVIILCRQIRNGALEDAASCADVRGFSVLRDHLRSMQDRP